MPGFRNKISCSRLLARTLLMDGIIYRNTFLTRNGNSLCIEPFTHETHSTPFFNRVEVSGNPPAVIGYNESQSIIIEI